MQLLVLPDIQEAKVEVFLKERVIVLEREPEERKGGRRTSPRPTTISPALREQSTVANCWKSRTGIQPRSGRRRR
jgi:hypothetical protein